LDNFTQVFFPKSSKIPRQLLQALGSLKIPTTFYSVYGLLEADPEALLIFI